MNLVDEVFKLSDELTASIRKLANNGRAKAEAERDYKIALSQEAFKLKIDKDMPVTLIDKTVYGLPKIAELRFKRDLAETMWQTNLEYINITKIKIKMLENQISREWNAKGDI